MFPRKQKEIKKEPEVVEPQIINDSVDYGGTDRLLLQYGKRLSRTHIKVTVFTEATSEVLPAKIVDDHKLVFTRPNGEQKTVYIYDPPKIEERKGRFGVINRTMMFYTSYRSEATHDPEKTALDLPAVELANKYIVSLAESDIPKKLVESVEAAKKWYEYIPYVLLFLSPLITMALIFYFLT